MLKLGFVGAGRMGRAHAGNLRNQAGCQLHGVFDPVPEAAESFARDFKLPKIYASRAELAADSELNGVLICNYADQHYETLAELIRAGKKRIFCEKPLVRRLADGEALLKQAQAAGAQIMVGHHRRYQPGYAKLREVVESGMLGTIRLAKVAFCHPGYAREWGTYFADFARCGGVILDNETHHLDLLNWYFGVPLEVSARSLRFPREMPQPMDYVSATLVYPGGVICNLDASWQRYGEGYDRLEIYGDRACAVYKGEDKVHVYLPGEHRELAVGQLGAAQMEALVRFMRDGETPRVTLQEGFNSARVGLALIESAESGKVVTLA